MKVQMKRQLPDNGKQTISKAAVIENGKVLFSFFMLELPWLNNQRGISCIPLGTYTVEKKDAGEDGSRFNYPHFEVLNVPGRQEVKWHKGNFYTDIRGCMLPGTGLSDINKDGQVDVTNNAVTLSKLWNMLPETFTLEILKS